MTDRTADEIIARFHDRYIVVEPGGCWVWTSYDTGRGYGQMRVAGRTKLAHRLSWEIHHGLIPDGKLVRHHCDVRECVNPAHLYLGTPARSTQDAVVSLRKRFEANVDRNGSGGCWQWKGSVAGSGYGRLGIGTKGSISAHRLSWEIHRGPIPSGLFVLHHCDNPCCVNPDHLYVGDHVVNMADMAARGRAPNLRGEASGSAKLTEAKVREIKSLAGQISQREIGERFDIGQNQVGRIIRGESWRHLNERADHD